MKKLSLFNHKIIIKSTAGNLKVVAKSVVAVVAKTMVAIVAWVVQSAVEEHFSCLIFV